MQAPKVDWDKDDTVIFSTPEQGPTVEGVRKMMEMTRQLRKKWEGRTDGILITPVAGQGRIEAAYKLLQQEQNSPSSPSPEK